MIVSSHDKKFFKLVFKDVKIQQLKYLLGNGYYYGNSWWYEV